MKLRTRLLSLAAFALCARLPLPAADTIEIKQQWQAGKKYYQTIQTDQQSSVEIGPQKMEQTTSMTIELTMAVSAHQDGQPKRMVIRYERMAMQVGMNGQKMGYDSAKPAEGGDPLNLSKTIGATVGQELKVVFNDKDEVDKVENYDEFIAHLSPAAVPGFDPAKMFNRESLTQMLKQGSLQAVPGKPVTAGDSWSFSNQVDLPQLGKVSVTGKYTLKGVGDHDGVRCAEIQTEGALAMDLGAATDTSSPLSALGMKVTDGNIKGPVWFDPALGIARESQLTQEMNITMKNPADPTATLNVPMKQQISVKLTKIEDLK
ncbi:MAG: DUF6263 family protein [Chthoniobacter sp.]|uniref:DUF6263 family protein n=1 Tax=Chthoniobacter sp. TaxID=2510640 RepID=UPI0032A7922B